MLYALCHIIPGEQELCCIRPLPRMYETTNPQPGPFGQGNRFSEKGDLDVKTDIIDFACSLNIYRNNLDNVAPGWGITFFEGLLKCGN